MRKKFCNSRSAHACAPVRSNQTSVLERGQVAVTQLISSKMVRAGVRAELTKWWKYYTPIYGETIRTVSPMNQRIMSPLFKDLGHKITHRIVDRSKEMWLGAAFGVVMYGGTEAYSANMKLHHRH